MDRFGVSRPTVARALRDLQDRGLVERRVGSDSFVRAAGPVEVTRQFGLLITGLGTTEIFDIICGELAGLARRPRIRRALGRRAGVSQSAHRHA